MMKVISQLVDGWRSGEYGSQELFDRIMATVTPENILTVLSAVPDDLQEGLRRALSYYTGDEELKRDAQSTYTPPTIRQILLLKEAANQQEISGEYVPPPVIDLIKLGLSTKSFSIKSSEFQCDFCTVTSASFSSVEGEYKGWVHLHFLFRELTKVKVSGAMVHDTMDETQIAEFVELFLEKLGLPKQNFEARFFKPINIKLTSKIYRS